MWGNKSRSGEDFSYPLSDFVPPLGGTREGFPPQNTCYLAPKILVGRDPFRNLDRMPHSVLIFGLIVAGEPISESIL